MSQWEKLFNFLKENGFEIYSPEQKTGQCTSPYLCITYGGSSKRPDCSTNDDIYTIFCYVPKGRYSFLDTYVHQVKKVMDKFYPQFIPSGFETASYYDEDIKAHMVSIDYINHKKIQRR